VIPILKKHCCRAGSPLQRLQAGGDTASGCTRCFRQVCNAGEAFDPWLTAKEGVPRCCNSCFGSSVADLAEPDGQVREPWALSIGPLWELAPWTWFRRLFSNHIGLRDSTGLAPHFLSLGARWEGSRHRRQQHGSAKELQPELTPASFSERAPTTESA
jgi:hypothetical protein